MLVSIVKGKERKIFECAHVCEFEEEDRIRVELCERVGNNAPRFIEIPADGDSIYYMNNNGKTTGAVHWPPRDRQEERREDATVQAHGG